MKPMTKRTTHEQPKIDSSLGMVLDPCQDLYRLAGVIDWAALEVEFGGLCCADNGRPGAPIRLLAGLPLLKHTFGHSGEEVVQRWLQNLYYQFFCGEEYFQHELPSSPSQMTKWRKRIRHRGSSAPRYRCRRR